MPLSLNTNMLKGWGTWLGLESAPGPKIESADINVTDLKDEKTKDCKEVNIPTSVDRDGEDQPQQLLQKAKGLSGRLLNFASSTSKKLSESVSETAEKIKKSVEEGKIDGIIDKTIWGDFNKEQNKFVQERNAKKSDAAVPPWVGYNEEETIQQQMLALSADKRNFLRDPPAGVQFQFDFEQMYPIALVMLQEDELLNRMRFDLVPKHVKEDVFWRNYFYRVSLIKQSAQLTALAAQQQAARKNRSNPDNDQKTGNLVRPKPPITINAKPETNEDEADLSTCPGVSEFVSDAFDSSGMKKEDLRREMEQLEFTEDDGAAAWERELQRELQDYEVVAGGESPGEQWEREIEELLQQE